MEVTDKFIRERERERERERGEFADSYKVTA